MINGRVCAERFHSWNGENGQKRASQGHQGREHMETERTGFGKGVQFQQTFLPSITFKECS